MVQTWDGEKLILKSWIFLVDHFKKTTTRNKFIESVERITHSYQPLATMIAMTFTPVHVGA